MIVRILAAAGATLIVVTAGADAASRTLTLDDRVAAQKAIERVYWSHRIWPKENPGPKPPLEELMPDAAIRAKVVDSVRQSSALSTLWQRPITADQLQAEIDRMVRETRDGATLAEVFHALNDDPFLIAECLARPILSERLLHNWYAHDERFHGALPKRSFLDWWTETRYRACGRNLHRPRPRRRHVHL
jgi:hypothetical protein